MKSASAAMQTHIDQGETTLVNCWKLKRRDGTILAATEHDRDLPIDVGDGDGEITYKAATGYSRSNIQFTHDMKVDNHEISGLLNSAAITEADIVAGRYDGAEVKQFMVNWEDLTMGIVKISRSEVGKIEPSGGGFTATMRGLTDAYSQEIVDLITPGCPVRKLGDAFCGVRLDPPAWTASTAYTVRPPRDAKLGSVVKPPTFNDRHFKCITAGTSDVAEPTWDTTIGNPTSETGGSLVVWEAIRASTIEATVATVTSRRAITLTYAGDAPDAFLLEGLATFTSGPNSGVSREVKSWTLTGNILLLFDPMPFDITIGESLTVAAGCIRNGPTCRDTFDNIFNHRGWPHVPGNDAIFKVVNGSQ